MRLRDWLNHLCRRLRIAFGHEADDIGIRLKAALDQQREAADRARTP